jgi:hypothetical protein
MENVWRGIPTKITDAGSIVLYCPSQLLGADTFS